ncbi:MAG: nucleotidyl transferase AbiEii/AbiGii toxin family protein [Anaerolineales bacterium]|nr:nucleotidyl transferase AbiEii/AbiGii toxin family protein [Anaerolineales bacterium]
MFYPNILNDYQQELVDKLKFDSVGDFYLSGGTALALQMGHRTSVDFDFYSAKDFDSFKLFAHLRKAIPDLTVRTQTEGTLLAFSETTEISFFHYPYILIRPAVAFEGLILASKEDIAAMKLIAIVQRGTERDFVDVFYLLQEYTLAQMIAFVQEKFAGYQEALILKALVFFEDAEKEEQRRGVRILAPDYSWEAVKKFLRAQVKKYEIDAQAK